MRPIDADKLKDELVKHFDAYFNDKGQLMYSDHICTSDDVSDLFNLINKQSTVYDVDKIVGQLKTDSSVKLYGSGNSNNFLIPVERAIKIVKAGGNP